MIGEPEKGITERLMDSSSLISSPIDTSKTELIIRDSL